MFFLAAGMLLFNSCEKVPGHLTGTSGSTTGSTGGTTTGSSTLTFKVDGVAKTSALTAGYYVTSQTVLQIISSIGSVEGLTITIQNPAVGTFPITANNTLCTYNNTSTDTYLGTAGSVIITAFTSDTVTGTFNFAASTFSGTTKNISEGVFNVKYTKQ